MSGAYGIVTYTNYDHNNLIRVGIDKSHGYKFTRKVKNPGWFSGYHNEEYWETDSPEYLMEQLFILNIKDLEITVYDERVYDFCKKFGKKHKLKKLYKCWEGVV